MSLTVQQMVLDAKKLVIKLKESDSAADSLISKSQNVYKLLDTRKQYSEDVNHLNEAARQKPHTLFVANIQQESRHLRQLQKENRDLRMALDEYNSALEMIMSKYREQVTQVITSSRLNLPEVYNRHQMETIQKMSEKIQEMGSVMSGAAKLDEDNDTKTAELISRLTVENRGLRELLALSNKYNSTAAIITDKTES